MIRYVGFPFLAFSRFLPCLMLGPDCEPGSALLENPSGAVLRFFAG
jgi:hypothetical protein